MCGWCTAPLASSVRRDAKFCSKRCRQASHRFGKGMARELAAGEPIRVAYADPPYPGKAHLYRGHRDYAGEVDHQVLIEHLVGEYPDGWALSTSAEALPEVLAWCPPMVKVAAWVRGARPNKQALAPLSGWEPVIYMGGRLKVSPRPGGRVDALVHHARARTTDPDRVVGAKPAAFIWWLFDLLGLAPDDELVDLFPGSGGVGRAWERFSGRPAPGRDDSSPACRDDVSVSAGGDVSAVVQHDPSWLATGDAFGEYRGADGEVDWDAWDAEDSYPRGRAG